MRVLITRDDTGAKPYADLVASLGGEAVICPLLEIEPAATPLPVLPDNAAIIFTSVHGIESFCGLTSSRHWPVYVVGPQTADAARSHGFRDVRPGRGTAADLAHKIIAQKPAFTLYARGRDAAFPMHETLIQNHIPTEEVVLYDAVPVHRMNILQDIDIAVFFSTRAAQIFVDLAQEQGLKTAFSGTKALCLGGGMVEFLSTLDWQEISVAEAPDRASMMAMIERNIVGYM